MTITSNPLSIMLLINNLLLKKYPPVIIALLLSLYSCTEVSKYSYPKVEIENYSHCEEYDISPFTDYQAFCKCAEENQLTFPTSTVQYGRLIINNAEIGESFQFEDGKHILDEFFIETFRMIVSDSSNFRWGELSTQHTCYIIEFFDSSDKLINRASITCGGMLSLEPSFGVTKWGQMNHEADSLLFSLIKNYHEN